MSELTDNKKLEDSIWNLQKNMTQEQLAVTLTNVRKSMKAGAQVIVPVQSAIGEMPQVAVLDLEDGKWLYVYTNFEEQKASGAQIQSTFLGSLDQVVRMANASDQVEGIIINPYNCALRLDKQLLQIVIG